MSIKYPYITYKKFIKENKDLYDKEHSWCLDFCYAGYMVLHYKELEGLTE